MQYINIRLSLLLLRNNYFITDTTFRRLSTLPVIENIQKNNNDNSNKITDHNENIQSTSTATKFRKFNLSIETKKYDKPIKLSTSNVTSNMKIDDDDIVYYLCSHSKLGPKALANLAIEMSRNYPVQSKKISKKRFKKMRESLIQIFNDSLEHKESNFADTSMLCDKLIELGLMSNRDIFLETATEYMLKNGKYNDFFFIWSSYCLSEHTTAGGHLFFIHALVDNKVSKKIRQKRIQNILDVYEKIRHPADGLAQLIISMVLTNNYDDAIILWKRLSIDCIHFVKPLKLISTENNLNDVNAIHVKQIANLITECVINETKKKKHQKKPKNKDEDVTNDIEDDKVEETNKKEEMVKKQIEERGNVGFLLDRWRVFHRRRFFKSKSRKYTVKPDQLEKLLNTLEDVWIKIAESQNPGDKKHVLDELSNFIVKNDLVFEDKNKKIISRIYNEEKMIKEDDDR